MESAKVKDTLLLSGEFEEFLEDMLNQIYSKLLIEGMFASYIFQSTQCPHESDGQYFPPPSSHYN